MHITCISSVLQQYESPYAATIAFLPLMCGCESIVPREIIVCLSFSLGAWVGYASVVMVLTRSTHHQPRRCTQNVVTGRNDYFARECYYR